MSLTLLRKWRGPGEVLGEQSGLSTLETVLVFLGFVGLTAGFLYTVGVTGILASEQTRGVGLHALQDAPGRLTLSSSLIAVADPEGASIQQLRFQVSNHSVNPRGVDLDSENTIATYIDEENAINLSPVDWRVTRESGSGTVVNPGERATIVINLSGLGVFLGPSKTFTIEISPYDADTITIRRTTPKMLGERFDLR